MFQRTRFSTWKLVWVDSTVKSSSSKSLAVVRAKAMAFVGVIKTFFFGLHLEPASKILAI